MEHLSYTITPEHIEGLRTALDNKGLHLSGDKGEIRKFGADILYLYDGTTLSLTLVHAPHFHSMDEFKNSLDKAIQEQLAKL